MAISDCFNEWRIENAAYHISFKDYNVEELQFPFIAQTPIKGGLLMLVHSISKGKVTYSDEKNKKQEISEKDFLQKWSGVVFYAEASSQSGEEGYLGKQLIGVLELIKGPAFIALFLTAILIDVDFRNLGLGYAGLIVLKLIGLGISVLLLMHSINANNPLIQNLCSLGKKNSCNAILKSDAAKATSWLSWSEVGFFYFAGSLFTLLFVPSSLNLITLLNALSLPYTIWSIYYQYRHRNWCVLCCAVQTILWLEFITALVFNLSPLSFVLSPVLFSFSALSFSAPIMLWYVLKPTLQKASEYRLLKNQLKKFKYDSELFGHALTKQPHYAVPSEIFPITLGNPKAQTVITMVSNPFCGPCAKAHEILNQWLRNRNDIQLKIIFATADHEDDDTTKVVRHVAALSLTNDAALVEKALKQWYAQPKKNYEEWAKSFQVNIDESVHETTTKQKQWCDMAEITVTPTILVNGYRLPEPYQLEDLPYLIN